MTETRYPYTPATYAEAQLHAEVAALALPGFVGVFGSGATVLVAFADALSGAQEAQLDAAVAAHVPDPNYDLQLLYDAAMAELDTVQSTGLQHLRALIVLLVKELNILRKRDRDRAVDVAGAGTLQALKSAWALRPALADRTGIIARQAMRTEIAAGQANPGVSN